MRHIGIVLSLTVLWVVLWRDLSVANVLGGVLVATAVGSALSMNWAGGPAIRFRIRPVALAWFCLYFTWKLLEANVVLAREVVTPRNKIQTGVIAVRLTGYSDQVVTIVANAVSLTPGTLTIEVRRTGSAYVELYVHVLHLHDIDRAREDVRALARLAHAALQGGRLPSAEAGEAVS